MRDAERIMTEICEMIDDFDREMAEEQAKCDALKKNLMGYF